MSKKKGKTNNKSNQKTNPKIKVSPSKVKNPNTWKHQGR